MAMGVYKFDRDTRRVWQREAEELLVQLVTDSKRDENWQRIADRINRGGFVYNQFSEYSTAEGKDRVARLEVEAEHVRLYYDRQIVHKFRKEYIPPNYQQEGAAAL
eukprot:CAMPEP_0173188150 /NCGR_PEP_ID=MMETSP1141-20130122/11105_1 /TAXON_ID=483371 /ORGANISM="non described non described, Strain CCMP2298" /LENGTH=105 /DNA_ID=CAMNT_0014112067 /DNA_START=121 /DNA_END=439 /DNA_ORIENTATION=+